MVEDSVERRLLDDVDGVAEVELEETVSDEVDEPADEQLSTYSVAVAAVMMVAVLYSVVTAVLVYSVSVVVDNGSPGNKNVLVEYNDSKTTCVCSAGVSKMVYGEMTEKAVSVIVVEGCGEIVIVTVSVPEVCVMKFVVAGAGASVVEAMAVS